MMDKQKMRPMTTREKYGILGLLILAVWIMLAGIQGIAFVFFDFGDVKTFLAALVLGAIFACVWMRASGCMIEDDGTDEAGA
jgi:uncharacterized membrane protein